MRGVNRVILIGRVGREVEMRAAANGNMIANMSLATSQSWKDKNTGEQKEITEWHNVVIFGKLAEIASKFVKKGSLVYVSGYLKTTKFQDKTTGADRYSTQVVAEEMQMLDGKSDKKSGEPNNNVAPAVEGLDDDIPF